MANGTQWLAGRTALVTGATGGLGREIARELARSGCALALSARNRERLEQQACDLRERYGIPVKCFPCDLSLPDAAGALAAAVRSAGLPVDVLVNNAGFGYDAPFVESDLGRQRALLQTNDVALMDLTREFAPAMRDRRCGWVLNVASVAGFLPGPYMATYYASKAFVQSFSIALRAELAPCGVHVTALCPGPVRTPFWDNADAGGTLLARMAIDAPKVAKAGVRALRSNRAICAPGLSAKAVVFGSRLLPRQAIARIAARLQKPAR